MSDTAAQTPARRVAAVLSKVARRKTFATSLLIGLGLCGLFWVAVSLADALIFGTRSFSSSLLALPAPEICIRVIACCLLVVSIVGTAVLYESRAIAKRGSHASEHRLREIAENVDEAFWVTAPDDSRVYYISPAYEKITGRPCRALYEDPNSWLEMLHPEDRARLLDRTQQDGSRADKLDDEFRIIRPDGAMRWVWLRSWPVFDNDEMVSRAGVLVDVTERRRAEDDLRMSEARLRAIVSNTPNVAIQAYDIEGRVCFWSDPSERMFGWTGQEAIGRRLDELILGTAETNRFVAKLRRIDLTGCPEGPEEWRFHDKQGRVGYAYTTAFAIPTATGGRQFVSMDVDITELKNTTRELEHQRASLRRIIDMNPSLIFAKDREGRFTLVNKAVAEAYGTTVNALIGKTDADFNPNADEVEYFRRLDQKVLDSRHEEFIAEETITDADGARRWMQTVKQPIFNEDGVADQVLGVATDITERKQAELRLREAERKYRDIVENAPYGVYQTNPDGSFVSANATLASLFGFDSPEDLIAYVRDVAPIIYVDPNQRAEFVRLIEAQETVSGFESQVRRMDGAVVWVSESARLIRDADGNVLCYEGMIEDITKRRQAEKAVRENQERFKQIAETVGEVFFLSDADDHTAIYVSPAYEKIWGRKVDELYADGQAWERAVHPDDREKVAEKMKQYSRGRIAHRLEYRIVRPDGTVRWIQDRADPIFDDAGKTVRIINVCQDITQRKTAEHALQRAYEELEQRVRERTADLITLNDELTQQIAERERGERLQRGRGRMLERLTAGAPLDEVLQILVEVTERANPEMICSVLLLDESKQHLNLAAGPSLPAFYNEAIDGVPIGPNVGACGAAAFTGKRVIVEDIMTHPNWGPFREIAQRAELRACWSEPIVSTNDEVIGTFAMYYRETRSPGQSDLDQITAAAQLARIAIERKRAEAELHISHERLRLNDRLATIGTLATGLGHDMDNLLLPIRCRLDALDRARISPEIRTTLDAVHHSIDYLAQLSQGLKLMALDPRDDRASSEITPLRPWWNRVHRLFRSALPSNCRLEVIMNHDLPPVAMPAHRLTQALLNLVSNAGEAMPDGGRVCVEIEPEPETNMVRIVVSDKGVGVSQELRERVLDPFFTTKKRVLSTGIGLSLVHGAMRSAGGTIDIASTPGEGTTITLRAPAARAPRTTAHRVQENQGATLSIADPRLAAWMATLLRSAGYAIERSKEPNGHSLWVTDATGTTREMARSFLEAAPENRVIALGHTPPDWIDLGATIVEDLDDLDALRHAVRNVQTREQGEET